MLSSWSSIDLHALLCLGCPDASLKGGNNQQDVFFVDDDRGVYLELRQKSAQ